MSNSSIYGVSTATIALSLEVLRFEGSEQYILVTESAKQPVFPFLYYFLFKAAFHQADNCHIKEF